MLQSMEMTGPALSDADIDRVEQKLAVRLPIAYRKFLLQYNGGRPEPYYFDVAGFKGPGMVNDFNGLVPGAYNDLERHYGALRDKLPRGFVPVADDPGGNAVLIGTIGDTQGKIYWWDHEAQPYERGDELAMYPNIYPVAEDFDEFLRMLKERK